jgi:hypothetical protein
MKFIPIPPPLARFSRAPTTLEYSIFITITSLIWTAIALGIFL